MSRTRVRGLALFRTVLFLPQVIALVVVAVMWRMIYQPDGGLLNQGLRAIGLGGLTQDWLGSFSLALPSVGLIGTWVMYGLAMVLFTAGVQKIPQSLYDAARMDGAGPVREFFAVTLPGLRNEIAVALTLTTIQALRSFDLVYITTGGGPGDATTVPAFEVYNRAFRGGDVGTASAIGVCIAALIFVLTLADQPGRRAGGGAMIDRREQALTYALLGVFSIIALVPIVGILLTALQEPGQVANFGEPNGLHVANFSKAWNDGHFSQYLRSSAIVVVCRRADLGAALDPGRLRVRDDALPRRPGALLPVPARADGAARVDGRAALLRLPRPRADRHLRGADPAPGRRLARVRDVLDAGVLPLGAALAGGGRAARRLLELEHAVARRAAARAPGGADHDRARVHVDVERVPARARDGDQRGPADRAARPRVLLRAATRPTSRCSPPAR